MLDSCPIANRPDFAMRTSDEEAISPVLGASSATEAVPPISEPESESYEDEGKKKRSVKKDNRPWESVAMFTKGKAALQDSEEIKGLIYEAAKNIMEDSGLIRLSTHRPKPTDLHLWKSVTSWHSDHNTTLTTIYHCSLKTKFGCRCQFKVT